MSEDCHNSDRDAAFNEAVRRGLESGIQKSFMDAFKNAMRPDEADEWRQHVLDHGLVRPVPVALPEGFHGRFEFLSAEDRAFLKDLKIKAE